MIGTLNLSKICLNCSSNKEVVYSGPICKSCYKKQHYQANKSRIIARRMARYKENKQKEFEYQYARKRNDPAYRAACRVRTRVGKLLNDPSYVKSTSMGCTQQEFKKHLESQFADGMTWENYGNHVGQWNVDHVFPLSKAYVLGPKEFEKACHYTNLKPMWSIENRSKGNKI